MESFDANYNVMINRRPYDADLAYRQRSYPAMFSDGWMQATAGGAVTDKMLEFLGSLITKMVWSPIVFSGTKRIGTAFKSSRWLALDFDSPATPLLPTIEKFLPYIHIIGLSRSHQKVKNGVQCDRFRVVCPFVHTIQNPDDYKYTVSQAILQYGADQACSDLARLYYPCTQIVSFKSNGDHYPVTPRPAAVALAMQVADQAKAERYKAMAADGKMPQWIADYLTHGAPNGSRNRTCFKLGLYLGRLGYKPDQIADMIYNSPIRSNTMTMAEITKAVNNGFRCS